MYHRIDGKLVAVGILDLCTTVCNSAYFLYDPAFRFLNLGVIGALTEIQWLRLLKSKRNPRLQYYHLGELAVKCPKVSYKVDYGPGGMVMCPDTRRWLEWDKVKEWVEKIATMTVEEK